ncbi:MAG: peptide ABC transporter substrate-binding protein [Gemmatimonadaceae bacterium]
MRPHRTALLLLLLLLASACADRASDSAVGETGGTLVVVAPGSGGAPLLPPLAVDFLSRAITDNVFERLAEIGPEMSAIGDRGFTPRLAQRWEWAPDSLSIAFMLDSRARWHDGQPVRASDVRFTMRLLKDPKNPSQYTSLLENVDSVSVRDSLTAVAWFRKRTPEQFYDVAHQTFILPEHVLKDIPGDKLATSEAAMRPIGSGRFRFGRYEPGVRLELVADTANYRGRPKLDRVVVTFASDANAALAQLLGGQADFLENVPPLAWPRLDSSATLRKLPYAVRGYGFLGMNQRDPKRAAAPHPIFSDRRVRLALSMALDRQAMLRNLFDTLGTLGGGPFPKALADTTLKLPPFDRARAGALLDSAGWVAGANGMRAKNGRPLRFGILVPTSSAVRMQYAVLIQEQLKAVGAQADIESIDISAFVTRMLNGNFDMLLNALSPDPARSGTRQVWTAAGIPPAGQNYQRYSNPRVTALLDTAAGTFDPARTNDYYRRAFQELIDDAPAVWLYDVVFVAGIHKRIRVEGIRGDGWWTGLADWWIPANERIDRDRIGLRPAAQN